MRSLIFIIIALFHVVEVEYVRDTVKQMGFRLAAAEMWQVQCVADGVLLTKCSKAVDRWQ